MGENRNRIIWLENDVGDIKKQIQSLKDTVDLQTDFELALENQSTTIDNLAQAVDAFNVKLTEILESNRLLNTYDAKVWLGEMEHTCRQVKDSVTSIHDWQNGMARDFSALTVQVCGLADKVKENGGNWLRLAALADDRVRDLERQLEEATEHSRAVVARMEQLEARLRKLEAAQVKVTLSPNKTVHIPETIHCGGPIVVKLEPTAKRVGRPGEIQCQGDWR